MAFIKKGKTNWQLLLLLVLIVGADVGFILYYQNLVEKEISASAPTPAGYR